MAAHNILGADGEKMAIEWLEAKGYQILHHNWRHSYYEIDIVAIKGKLLHFIEVKSRSANRYGYPEDSVGKKKFKRLQKAADEYLFLNPGYKWIQYDILSITVAKNRPPEYYLLEDVFI
jgi:putative endonuclease